MDSTARIVEILGYLLTGSLVGVVGGIALRRFRDDTKKMIRRGMAEAAADAGKESRQAVVIAEEALSKADAALESSWPVSRAEG